MPMRVVVAIPHAFVVNGPGRFRSHAADGAARAVHVAECLLSLARLDGDNAVFFDLVRGDYVAIPQLPMVDVQIVLCAAEGRNLLDALEDTIDRTGTMVTTIDGEPMMAGFGCHAALAERIGDFDYYGYLEDDLAIRDGSFFAKVAWFNDQFGPDRVLLPHRCERSGQRRLYIDGDLPESAWRLLPERSFPNLRASWLDRDVELVRPGNPHSGSFFLSAEQMRRWAATPTFLDRDTSFIGPLESAATLGVWSTFDVYKPHPKHASFFEIEHLDRGHPLPN